MAQTFKCVECGSEYQAGSESGWRNERLCNNCFGKKPAKASIKDSSNYTSSYSTTITIAKVVVVLGWVTISAAAIFIFLAITSAIQFGIGSQLVLLVLSFCSILCGIFLILSGQVARAIVDNTDNTGEILALLKQQISYGK